MKVGVIVLVKFLLVGGEVDIEEAKIIGSRVRIASIYVGIGR